MNFKQEYSKYKKMYKELLELNKKKILKNNKINNGNIKMINEDFLFNPKYKSNKNYGNSININQAIKDLDNYFKK